MEAAALRVIVTVDIYTLRAMANANHPALLRVSCELVTVVEAALKVRNVSPELDAALKVLEAAADRLL